jgi:hypothetical protein
MDSVFKNFATDSDLLEAEFRVRDPLNSVEGLVCSKPDPDETPFGGRISNPDEPYIWCCHCQKDTHWKGYVVENGNENRFTIGNNCGHDHYGASFSASEKHFNEKRARQGVLRAFLRLCSKIDGLEEEINSVLACEALKQHDGKREEMRRAAPKAFTALKRAVERGSLSAIKKTRNVEAEMERAERYERALSHFRSHSSEKRRQLRDEGLMPEIDEKPIIDSNSVDFGHVVGTSVLGFDDPRSDALEVREALSDFRKIEKAGTETFASKEIVTKRKRLMEATKALSGSLISISFAEAFFEHENLIRIANWSACFRGFTFRLDGGHLSVTDDDQPFSTIEPIELQNGVATPVLDRIHYTDVEEELLAAGAAIMVDPDGPSSEVLV